MARQPMAELSVERNEASLSYLYKDPVDVHHIIKLIQLQVWPASLWRNSVLRGVKR